MAKLHYQKELSLQSPILLDAAYKKSKVEKMLAVLRDAGAVNQAPRGVAVDIGCSGGFFAEALSPYFHHVLGMDIDTHALRLAADGNRDHHVVYLAGDSMSLPLKDRSVDLIICNHVYEHVPDPERLFNEIYRVLRDDGECYLGAASRLIPIEPHYHLPFLSWLPKPLAHLYMRLAGKGDHYYENLRTYWGIRKLLSRFAMRDYTLEILVDPDRFQARDLLPVGGILARVPLSVWKAFYWFLPTYILILKKLV